MSTFTNYELELMFKGIEDKLSAMCSAMEEHHKEDITARTAILDQTILTNGRVRCLEQWRWGLAGGLSVVTAIVIPLGLKLLEMWGGK